MKTRQTPLMRQYREIRSQFSADAILLFQVGDFYETFYDDARELSRLVNVALTTRDKGSENPIPLAGVPIHAAETYIAKLLQAGRTVVVCDQAETVPQARGVVKRRVTDVITPGTTLSTATLAEKENNFLLSLVERGGSCGFAFLDLSTGEFTAGEETKRATEHIISGYTVREAVVPEGSRGLGDSIVARNPSCAVREIEEDRFAAERARDVLCRHFNVENLGCFGIEGRTLAVSAAGALLGYVKELRRNDLSHITGVRHFVPEEILFIDGETFRNLEVFEPLIGNTDETTLIHHIDRTVSPAGARELRSWLRRPSRAIAVIGERLDGVEAFRADQVTLRTVRRSLHRFPDIERIVSRASASKAMPRELLSLADALERLPGIAVSLEQTPSAVVARHREQLRETPETVRLIRASIDPDGPPHLREGGVIRKGFNAELDGIITESEEGRRWIAALQAVERSRTGIPSLKVAYNKIFGYYIEISRAHDRRVPDDYIVKQTLVSSQRYVTAQLKEKEQSILTAESRRAELERRIFFEVCGEIAREAAALQRIAKSIAVLDILSSLADLALDRNYCRPEVNAGLDLIVTEARHPVVETLSGKNFIPNDIQIRPDDRQVLIITGPNMGGKSTYIRQAAIITLLAHVGSYVPASRAVVGLVDRIFTRVGSSDNLARGQSTFLVEMAETAKILHNCTSRSLVILDEIGRGTGTLDGLSIAWAVTEYLLDTEGKRPKTLFATHYHELTRLAEQFPRVQNLTVDVKEWGDTVLFLYRNRPGATDKSYGIHVARLAGLPARVIERSREILAELERQEGPHPISPPRPAEQIALFRDSAPLRHRIAEIDIDSTPPLEALRILSELRRLADAE